VRALCKAVRGVDPAIALSVNIPALYLAQARLRSSGRGHARTVMTLHGIQSDLLGDAHAFRAVLDAVVCTNKLACELVRDKAGVPEERIHYAPYGVEIPAKPQFAERPASVDRPIRIAWVGRLEEEQKRVSDLPRILEALDARRQRFELWVVGSGPDELALRRELTRWLDGGQVRLKGELPRKSVFEEVLAECDCFLLTSSWETGPIVIWEAMAAGLPVVTSQYVGSGPEGSLTDGENCLMFPVGDAVAAAKCLSSLEDGHFRVRLGCGGREMVLDRYSVGASLTAWDGVFQKIANSDVVDVPLDDISLAPRGRLDVWLGTRKAESVRRLMRIRYGHVEAGGEWPHAISGPQITKNE